MTEPTTAGARDFLALVKLVQEEEWELAAAFVRTWQLPGTIEALLQGAALMNAVVIASVGAEGAHDWLVKQLSDLAQ